MLVALTARRWSDAKKDVILNKKAALARALGQRLCPRSRIASLGGDEPLWLFSHGNPRTFADMTPEELAGWLVVSMGMPAGPRQIVLKGCRTDGYAENLQSVLNDQEGYERVRVTGFAGVSSQTTADGEMTIRVGGASQRRRAAARGALAEIGLRRAARTAGRPKAEVDQEVATARFLVEADARTYPAVYDDGLNTFTAEDDRMLRRTRRRSGTGSTSRSTSGRAGEDRSGSDEADGAAVDTRPG